jgi:hypothetical protein
MATDPEMITSAERNNWDVQTVNEVLNREKIYENMDLMAIALAEPATGLASDAWAAIFQKPDGKAWADVTAGIVPNAAFGAPRPRLAVMVKLARELENLGVPGSNITIFDGGAVGGGNSANVYDNAYCQSELPTGVVIGGRPGGTKSVTLPNGDTVDCVTDVADGNFDLLVVVPTNKGHDIMTFTLCMKMGYGCIRFNHDGLNATEQAHVLSAIHKSVPMLGDGNPARTQLFVIDALYSLTYGPAGDPNRQTNTLLMGTFGPAVDHLTVHKVRDDVMNMTNSNYDHLRVFWEEFGYNPDAPEIQDLDVVNALTYEGPASTLPEILVHPSSLAVDEGAEAEFVVAAMGTGITYQWRKDGVDISGANESTYTIAEALLEDNQAEFDVVITNAAGSVPSTAAVLTVNAINEIKGPSLKREHLSVSIAVPAKPSSVRFSFAAKDRPRRLTVHTSAGRLVRSLPLPGGASSSVPWDGKDANGRKARAGMYVFKLRAGKKLLTRRAVITGS